ncbi:hypothetical protein GOP47_0013587 [Adiantum capillus-veneris]|uniref:Uncharacterized protein n=1 Tax=Adiantum capillus-veneris TaxID=13818 RepID=A0A9D4ZFX3_ADICA|nr:hypothetical protein GOP47_0013587 [Adiantum capillus-veneris]
MASSNARALSRLVANLDTTRLAANLRLQAPLCISSSNPTSGGEMKSLTKTTTWWAPHPETGIWAPEGDLFASVSSSSPLLDKTKAWFRDDVHAD